ncbi:MAG: PD-(D/E)XK nuclease family protein, partial [Verrucomicrobiota bacterium]
ARIHWSYDFPSAIVEPAKTSVSALRRRAHEADDVALPLLRFHRKKSGSGRSGEKSVITAAEIGTAHHTFLELVSLKQVNNATLLQEEAKRIQQSGRLSAEEVCALDLSAIAGFWNSEIGQKVLAQAAQLQREHPFTVRLNGNDPGKFGLGGDRMNFADEFIVLQGVIDLAVILRNEIWVLDFKTDQIKEAELGERAKYYRQQVALYADAMEKIYKRPVTKRWLHFLALQKTIEITVLAESM